MTVTKVKSKKNLKNGKKKTMKKNNFRKGRSMKGGSNVWRSPNVLSGPNVGSPGHFYPNKSMVNYVKSVGPQSSFKTAPVVVGKLPVRFTKTRYRGAYKGWKRK